MADTDDLLALRRAVVSGGCVTPHSCGHCADVELPPVPSAATMMQRYNHSGKRQTDACWSKSVRSSRTEVEQRALAGCEWWAFIHKQIRRHELVCKAKMNWKAQVGEREGDSDDSDDDEIQGLESVFLEYDEAELLESYLDASEYRQLLRLAKADSLFDSRVPSSATDRLDGDPNSVWIKYQINQRSSAPTDHLELKINLTLVSDGDVDKAASGRRSFEGIFMLLAMPGELGESVNITPPINVNPASSDSLNLMREWVHYCETTHECGFNDPPTSMPSFLLDVESLALEDCVKIFEVPPAAYERYVALSYCWGHLGQKVMNIKETRQRLLSGIHIEELDCSIRDAILVTRELGLKYIWIDALCIPQDDYPAKAKEISRMAEIYGCSTLTIYASRAATVQEGFLGERKPAAWGLEKQYGQQIAFRFTGRAEEEPSRKGEIILVPQLGYEEDKQDEPLQKRAWTLQELILPTRRLSFGTRKTTWTCMSQDNAPLRDGWTDNVSTLEKLDDVINANASKVVQMVSDMAPDEVRKSWYEIVRLYGLRGISFKSDRLPAISALSRVYSKVLKDEYLCGLWKSTLPVELLWTGRLSRQPKNPAPRLKPSWSWISHDGQPSWDTQLEFVRDGCIEVLGCTVSPKHSGDTFGGVEGASLRLRGLLYHASPEVMQRDPVGGAPPRETAKDINRCSPSELQNLNNVLTLSHTKIRYDFRESDMSMDRSYPDFYSSLYLLLVAYVLDPLRKEANPRCRSPRGLVLYRHQDGTFSRVGTFILCEYGTKNRDGQRLYSVFPDNDAAYNELVRGMWYGKVQDVIVV